MRKDNAIFFVSGLVFGLLLGCFVYESVSQSPGGLSAAATPGLSSGMGGGPVSRPAESRRVLDLQEVAALESMVQRNPADTESRVRLGNLYLEAGHNEQALPWFREALERSPANLHARIHLAQALANLQRLDEAVAEYEAVLANEPANPQALLGLGQVRLYGQQDVDGGAEAWEELLRVAPNSREAQSIADELEALRSAHESN